MLTETGRTLLDRWIYVLVKVDDTFVVPFTTGRLGRVEADPGYPPGFRPFLQRVLAALTAPGWAPGSYYPGGWFRMLAAQGADPLAAEITPEALRRFTLEEVRVERDGRWFVGPKHVEGRILRHFLRHLSFDPALGRYVIHYKLERDYETRYIHHESPPFRVQRVTFAHNPPRLHLNDGTHEPLRPESLRLDVAETLYCAVKAEAVPAVFSDEARWSLLQHAEERDGRWVLPLAGGPVTLPPPGTPWPYADRLPG